MNIPRKTLKNGFSLPIYGLGTWGMGGFTERDPQNDDETDIQAIQNAIDLGVTHIDTAESYAGGYAETLVGQAIKPYPREQLIIASKVSPSHLRGSDIQRSVERSLRRLGTDYLDLYMPHAYNPAIPLEETMRTLRELIEKGLIKNVGVSNFGSGELEEAQSILSYPIVTNQVHYSLTYQEPERIGLLQYSQNTDVFLVAWRPTGDREVINIKNPVIRELCEKYQKTPTQIALNWLMVQNNVVIISKTRSLAHLEENLGALGWNLSKQDFIRLKAEL